MTHPSPEQVPTASATGTVDHDSHSLHGRGPGATILLLAGLLCTGAGTAFAMAPRVSWHLAKIARAASELGIASGEMLVGGAVLLASSFLARSLARARAAAEQAAEAQASAPKLRLVTEQIALDVSHLQRDIQHISQQVAEIAQAQHSLLVAQPRRGGPPSQNEAADGLFRLAASLDQLHARVDERFQATQNEFLACVDKLAQQVADSRQSMEARLAAVSASLISSPLARGPFAPEPERSTPAKKPDPLEVVAELERRSAADESAIEFFETLEELDALAGGHSTDAPSHPIDFDGMDFGDLGLRKPAPGQSVQGAAPSVSPRGESPPRAPLPSNERQGLPSQDERLERFFDEKKRS